MYSKYKKIVITAIILTFSLISCKKFVEVDAPVTSTNSINVFSTDATAAAVLTGIYMDLSNNGASLSIVSGLSADEITPYGGASTSQANYLPVFLNTISPSQVGVADYCGSIYPIIYILNSSIEGLNRSNSLTPSVKQQLLGESYFMRAFYYFYLVNLYGDVPLAITTDYVTNRQLFRSPKVDVYHQIISDLKQSQTLLSNKYLKSDVLNSYTPGTEERVRPTAWAATALLARTYLYTNDWKGAEAEASKVIENTSLFRLTTLNDTFLKNNIESIWQLQPVSSFYTNTNDGALFIFPETGPNYLSLYLSDDVVSSFELGDQRKVRWVQSITADGTTYFYPFKYKIGVGDNPVKEYTVVMRLAEQYLIRAEARAQQGNIDGAVTDLNVIRNRAGLEGFPITNKVDLLSKILHERQIEFFTEWGHRWFDLKRTGNIDQVMKIASTKKGGVWNSNMQLFPFNVYDLSTDPNLIQNPGY